VNNAADARVTLNGEFTELFPTDAALSGIQLEKGVDTTATTAVAVMPPVETVRAIDALPPLVGAV
jgi:hypothetical protein